MTLIEMLRARLDELEARRALLVEEADQIAADPEARGLDVDSAARRVAELGDELAAVDAELSEKRELIAAQEQREQRMSRALDAVPAFRAARVTSEPATYSRETSRQGVSILRDLVSRDVDPDAAQRLARHAREHHVEHRAVGSAGFGALVVPQYLVDLFGPAARAGRPLADICTSRQLPGSGMTIELARITTGTSAAAQTGENAAVSETDLDETTLSVPVRTIAGAQTVSVQAVERGEMVEEVLIADLAAAYHTALDSQLISGTGATGQILGVLSTAGVNSVSYTDGTPTAAELVPRIADAIQQIQSTSFGVPTHVVMHPRRWWWVAKELSATQPLIAWPSAGQTIGQSGGTGYGAQHQLMGLQVVLDANIPTNLGAGTNEDVILVVSASELHLFEQAGPLFIRAEQPAAKTLGVTYVVYSYAAFTAGRRPAAHAKISGTGLVTPTF